MSAILALQEAINTKLRRTYTQPEIADVLAVLRAAGWVVGRVPDEHPGVFGMDEWSSGWCSGHHACRAAFIASASGEETP